MKGIHNKVAITVEGGIATLYGFPLDIAVCITDKDEDSDTRQGGNRYDSLATRWEYLCKRVDHDTNLICRLTIKKLLKIFPYYFDADFRDRSAPDELVINGENEWWLGESGLRLCRMTEDIKFDELETKDSFDFVQALMMDQQVLLEEITRYGESYKQSRLASRGD